MGLKNDTIQKLVSEDIDTSDILRLCSVQDIDEFRFSRGQTLVLKQWVTLLNCEDVAPVNPPSETSETSEVSYTTSWARWRLQLTPEEAPPPPLSVSPYWLSTT